MYDCTITVLTVLSTINSFYNNKIITNNYHDIVNIAYKCVIFTNKYF